MGRKHLPSLESLLSTATTTKFIEAINDDSDLVRVLVIGNYLDQGLAALLSRHLLPGDTREQLLGHQGILGTYRARVDICYCLRLITKKAKQNLKVIAQIRNKCAYYHEMIDFDDEEITRLCRGLFWSSSDPDDTSGPRDFPFDDVVQARTRFGLVSVALLMQILKTVEQMPTIEEVT